MKPPRIFMVIWDDDQGLRCPMTWEPNCEGALCGFSFGGKVALFPSRKKAREAIRISVKFAELRQAQGKTPNSDFVKGLLHLLHIVECQPCLP